MPEESGTWNGRGQIKPGRGRRECRRLHCHVRDRETVECSNFHLGGGTENLNPSCLLQAKKKKVSFNIFSLFFVEMQVLCEQEIERRSNLGQMRKGSRSKDVC